MDVSNQPAGGVALAAGFPAPAAAPVPNAALAPEAGRTAANAGQASSVGEAAPSRLEPAASPAARAAAPVPARHGRATLRRTVLGLSIPVAVLVAWTAVTSAAVIPSTILPSPATVVGTFFSLVSDGTLGSDLSVSLFRVVVGYAVASALGIVVGTLCGMFRTSREVLLPVITAVRQIPLLAWIPLIILWFGIGELSKVVFIVLAAFFPIMMNTMAGIASTPLEYIEVARLNKLSPWKTFLRVYLPHALPSIQTGLKLGLGISWMAVVGAELIASSTGIGYRMSYARTLMQSDVVIVCMLVVGVIGIVMDKALGLLFTALTPWERKGRERA